MEKKRSKGIVIFGILLIIFSILMIFANNPQFKSLKALLNAPLLDTIMPFFLLTCSIGALNLLSWGRSGLIIGLIYYIIDTFSPLTRIGEAIINFELDSIVIITIGLAFFISTIYYLTRPKVKEQFK